MPVQTAVGSGTHRGASPDRRGGSHAHDTFGPFASPCDENAPRPEAADDPRVGPILAARSGRLSAVLPRRLLGGFRFVERVPIVASCPHLDGIEPAPPGSDVCDRCVALGDDWVHLRYCLTCGMTGCCDDSKNKHATAHVRESGHPTVASLDPGQNWRFCHVDEVLVPDPEPRAVAS